MPLNPGRAIVKRLSVLLCLLVSLLAVNSHAQQQSVRAELSSATITRDESVNLTVVAVGLDEELDISALDKDFEVVGRSSSRQISTVVGNNNQPVTTSEIRWVLELLPRDVGVFTIPAVTVGGVPSQLLTLTVNDVPSGASRDVFVQASVDTQTPWVQSQVVMTLKVYQAIDIVDGGLDVPTGNDLVVERIGDDTRSSETVDGRQYSVTTRKFALFAQKSGPIRIEPITLSVSVPADSKRVRGFFSPTRKLTRRTDPIVLDVQARPDGGAAWWLPARAVELESQWAGDAQSAQVDQPLTRTIMLRASGVLDSQMPDINIPAIDGASLYAEEPQRGTGSNEAGLYAEQVVNWAVIPQRAGELTLPAVSVEWFNTRTGQTETATLPEETIMVSAATSTQRGTLAPDDLTVAGNDDVNTNQLDDQLLALSDNAQQQGAGSELLSPQSDQVTNPDEFAGRGLSDNARVNSLERSAQQWRTGALLALVLWLLTCAAWFFNRRRREQIPHVSSDDLAQAGGLGALRAGAQGVMTRLAPLAEVEACCQAAEPVALQQALMEWAARQWPHDPPQTLTSLAALLPAGEARNAVNELDALLYSRAGNQRNGNEFMASLSGLPQWLKQAMTQHQHTQSMKSQNGTGNTLHSLPEL